MTVKIYFDGEEGVVRGTKAERLSLLIRRLRVHFSELAGNLAVKKGLSVVPNSQIEPRSDGEHFQVGGRDLLVRDELQSANASLKELDMELEKSDEGPERRELEHQRQKLLNRVRRLGRTGPRETRLAKERVTKFLTRLRDELHDSMPNFVEHFDRPAVRFDEISDTYVYDPGDNITWEIQGF